MRRYPLVTAFTAAGLLAGCSAAPTAGEAARVATVLNRSQDGRIGTYVSSAWGFSTSSYWIEGPDGLVVIDTQFLPSAAEELLRFAEASTGKKVKLAVVLHPNPDKFNGTGVFGARGIPVVTSAQVLASIPAVHEKRLRAFGERYKPDYPQTLALPESFGSQTTELVGAGLTLKAHVLGPGCSDAHVAVEFDGNLFVGDLVANGSHSWLEIGKTDEWLRRIDELNGLHPRYVHPGRGPSAGPELLAGQKGYLENVIAEVAAERPSGAPDKVRLEAIKSRLVARYPGLTFPVFLDLGLPAEWRRQAQVALR